MNNKGNHYDPRMWVFEIQNYIFGVFVCFLLLKNINDDKCARILSPSKSKKLECPPPAEQVSTLLHLLWKAPFPGSLSSVFDNI